MSITTAKKRNVPRQQSRPSLWLRLFIGFFLVVFILGGLYAGYLFYATVRAIVAQTDLPSLPVVQFPSFRPADAAAGAGVEEEMEVEPIPELPEMTPVASALNLSYTPPQRVSTEISEDRINVLLLGIDRRGSSGWGYRTDTIIIVTVDPRSKAVGMMSIPRDLYLSIPGYGENRINVANVWGYTYDYPGGGPALLKRTIEHNFGIPLDYYVMVDFDGFKQVVDELGGIDVNVPRDLHDTMYPDPRPGDPYAYKTVHFDAGWQHMNGQRALTYARSRMSTSDFDRARRQQLILIAIRERALSLNIIPKLPALFATMGHMVKTDMTLDEMVELAMLAPEIDMGNLQQLVLDHPYVKSHRTETGAAVQLPRWDLIDPAVGELFSAPVQVEPTSTPAPPTPTPTLAPVQIEGLEQLAQEGARIAVQNGTSEPNFAARVAAMLLEQGFQVVEFGDADRLDYPSTVIVDYTDKTYSLERLIELFQVTPENVRRSSNLSSQFDIRIIVGHDTLISMPAE
ncbi:MAG TPA: LCP family protein [Anaerolineae bacterium]|nr:LCP family protein [Anaerolineae bacterium]